jgi:hypothetical protein
MIASVASFTRGIDCSVERMVGAEFTTGGIAQTLYTRYDRIKDLRDFFLSGRCSSSESDASSLMYLGVSNTVVVTSATESDVTASSRRVGPLLDDAPLNVG